MVQIYDKENEAIYAGASFPTVFDAIAYLWNVKVNAIAETVSGNIKFVDGNTGEILFSKDDFE